MEPIRGIHNLRADHRGCVATIGNFDGVHLGHQALVEQLVEVGKRHRLPTMLVTFEPQPQEFFAGVNAPPRLTRFKEKIAALNGTPLERVLVVRFDKAFSEMAPADFVKQVLVDKLGAGYLVVGADFRFGHGGEGNFDLLTELGMAHGFEVAQRATFTVDGTRASSTWVRDALANGELEIAERVLGRPYSICGRVEAGRQLGRTIGFATANIALRRNMTPLKGVYAVRVHGIDGGPHVGMANLGRRPTVDGTNMLLEVHLFDFHQDIYRQEIRVDFLLRLRDERKFAGIDALKEQLKSDAADARAHFAELSATKGTP